ncbi:MAG: hypothetical protein J6U54_04965 [Clostridiales bacterium]|nr:hypothetical protein [Clostridiales bacterium]
MTVEKLETLIEALEEFKKCDEYLCKLDAGVSRITVDFCYDGCEEFDSGEAKKVMVNALRDHYYRRRDAAAKLIEEA